MKIIRNMKRVGIHDFDHTQDTILMGEKILTTTVSNHRKSPTKDPPNQKKTDRHPQQKETVHRIQQEKNN